MHRLQLIKALSAKNIRTKSIQIYDYELEVSNGDSKINEQKFAELLQDLL